MAAFFICGLLWQARILGSKFSNWKINGSLCQGPTTHSSAVLAARVTNQNHIRLGMPANQGQLLAIK
jgi:hypothetical protein